MPGPPVWQSSATGGTLYTPTDEPLGNGFLRCSGSLCAITGASTGIACTTLLKPHFAPIEPQGRLTFDLQAMQASWGTPSAGNNVSMAVYSVNYTAANTFAASLIASTAAIVYPGAAPQVVRADVGTPATLDFRTTRYFFGICMQDTVMKFLGLSPYTVTGSEGSGGLGWTATAFAAVTSWPASFDQASVGANTKIFDVTLVSAYGKLMI